MTGPRYCPTARGWGAAGGRSPLTPDPEPETVTMFALLAQSASGQLAVAARGTFVTCQAYRQQLPRAGWRAVGIVWAGLGLSADLADELHHVLDPVTEPAPLFPRPATVRRAVYGLEPSKN